MVKEAEREFFTTEDGLRLYYELSRARNDSAVVVFINGLSQTTQAWAGVIPLLKPQCSTLCLDLIHQGKSDEAADYRSYDQHSADVASLCKFLGLTQIVLCGISYGSAVAQHALVNYPEQFRRAVLVSTFAYTTPLFEAIGESWKSALRSGGYPLMFDVMLPVVLGESYFNQPLIPIPLLKSMRTANEISTSRLLKLMEATERRGDYRTQLEGVHAQVTVLHGMEDLLITQTMSHDVHVRIKNSRFVAVPNAGHTLNLEAIESVAKAVNELV
jgi:3-oxoadipate enol-lactonase